MMSFNPIHLWASMGLMSKIVTSVLLVMALCTVTVVVERWIALLRGTRASQRFAAAAGSALTAREFDKLVTLSDENAQAPLSRLVGATVKRYIRARADGVEAGDDLTPIELAKREGARQTEELGADLRRGMGMLATIGSISPFVGLLGTVVGIITAFQGIAATGSGGLGAVSGGIAEALVETALGLMVAIPSVLIFNFLSNKITRMEGALQRSLGELIDEMETHQGRESSGRFTREAQAAE